MSLGPTPAAFSAAINAAALVFACDNASVAVAAVACTPTFSDAVSGLTVIRPSPLTVIDLTSDPAAGAGSGEAIDTFESSRPTQAAAATASMPTTDPPTSAVTQRVFITDSFERARGEPAPQLGRRRRRCWFPWCRFLASLGG